MPLKFSQAFHLMPTPNNSFIVTNGRLVVHVPPVCFRAGANPVAVPTASRNSLRRSLCLGSAPSSIRALL
jgi:hypothetical protein